MFLPFRLGGMMAPPVALYLPRVTSPQAPLILMGCLALLGSALTTLLPETLGSLTVQSVADVDKLKTGTKPFFAYWSRSKLRTHLEDQMAGKKEEEIDSPLP